MLRLSPRNEDGYDYSIVLMTTGSYDIGGAQAVFNMLEDESFEILYNTITH